MDPRSWAVPVGEDATAQVTLESTGDRGARYRIEFPFLVGEQGPNDVQVTGAGTVEDHRLRSQSGRPVSDLDVTVPSASDLERLVVRSRAERIVIHLPSGELLDRCGRVLEGDESAAEALIEGFRSPVQIPLVCGGFLGPADTVRLVEELVRRDRYVQSRLHAYRYAIVRGAVASRTGLHVRTYRELRALVDGLDAIAEIGPVSLIDAVADVMATVLDSPAETERLLDALGVELESLADRDDGLLTACLLAQIVVADGAEAATRYELPRTLPPRGHYDRRKRAVFQAAYGTRGTAWRRLLDAARRRSEDEVGYVLAYTLYWTGEESRSDSRMAELLLRGAERAAAHKGLRKIATKARYGRLVAAGHRLRGTHCWGPAAANFEAACELAGEHYFLDEWEPLLSRGLVVSRGRSLHGDHRGAVTALDATMAGLLETSVPRGVANRSIRHLRAQKCEIESLRHRVDDPARARDLLEEAKAHYAAIGFERSRDKVVRLLEGLPEVPTAEAAEPLAPAPDEPVTTVDEAVSPAAGAEAPADPEFVPDEPSELDEDWLEGMEYPDEDELTEDYDQRFEDPSLF